MTRECPVCHVPLKPVSVKGRLQLDFCLTCRGLWFDKDELTQAQSQGKLPEKFLGLPNNLIRDQVVCQSCGSHSNRSKSHCERCGAPLEFLCPACRIQMEEVAIGEVYIDRCQSCQGVWLDGGELALLFEEYQRKKQHELQRARNEGGEISGDLATWAALDALDLLIWRPHIAYGAGEAVVDVVTGIPGALAEGAGTVIEGIGNIPEMTGDLAEGTVELASGAAEVAGDVIENIPEMAGNLAEGTVELASGAAEVAGDVVGGAIDLAGEIPELAGAVAEAGASFIEILFEIIASIFDN